MKKFTSGLLAGIILATSVTTFAAGGKMLEVFYNVNKIVVNKISKPFSSATKPFIYNGTTFVPLRFIAEALGENVSWDGKTGTISIGEGVNGSASCWGKDLISINQQYSKYNYDKDSEYISDSQGDSYTNYLTVGSYVSSYAPDPTQKGYAEFALNSRYKTFKADLGIPYQYKDFKGDRIVKIYLDDKLAYETKMKAGDLFKKLNINVTGVNKIRFEHKIENKASSLNWGGAVPVGFFNGEFIK